MLKRFLLLTALSACASMAFAADVGVSISVSEPGFYGRIDLGDIPPPPVIYSKPRLIRPLPSKPMGEPVYLRVPAGHARHWRKHCKKYNACGQPVYFVQEQWFNEVYVPRHAERRGPPDENRGRGDRDHGDHGNHGRGH